MSEANNGEAASPFPKPKHLDPAVAASLRRYWRSNVKLMAVLLLLWALAGLGCGILFADAISDIHLAGFPLGFWFAQQGAIVVFVLVILAYAFLMNRLDAKHHKEIEAIKAAKTGGDL